MLIEYKTLTDISKTYYIDNRRSINKYILTYCDGLRTHEDGSMVNDIRSFKNKKDLLHFLNCLKDKGFKARY